MTAAVYQITINSLMMAARLAIVTQWEAHLRVAINPLVSVPALVEQKVSLVMPAGMGISTSMVTTVMSALLASAITTQAIVGQLLDMN